jgi:hypothetical protein
MKISMRQPLTASGEASGGFRMSRQYPPPFSGRRGIKMYQYDGEESTMKKERSAKKHKREERGEHKGEKERSDFSCSDLSCCDVKDSCGCYYDPCGNYYISACCC